MNILKPSNHLLILFVCFSVVLMNRPFNFAGCRCCVYIYNIVVHDLWRREILITKCKGQMTTVASCRAVLMCWLGPGKEGGDSWTLEYWWLVWWSFNLLHLINSVQQVLTLHWNTVYVNSIQIYKHKSHDHKYFFPSLNRIHKYINIVQQPDTHGALLGK